MLKHIAFLIAALSFSACVVIAFVTGAATPAVAGLALLVTAAIAFTI